MIPYARIAGFLHVGEVDIERRKQSEDGKKFAEVRQVQILSIGEESLVVRAADPVEHVFKIELHIYDDRKDHFDTITLPDPVLTECHQEAFCVLYTFGIRDETYREAVRKMDVQYSHYVMRKLEQDDAALAEDYTGYPTQEDEQITTDFVALRDRWYEEIELAGFETIGKQVTFAIELDNPGLWTQYEEHSIQLLWKDYWEEHHLTDHPFAGCESKGIYIGNQFCHKLFPEWEQLERMLDKAKRERLQVTIMTTYLREDRIQEMQELLEQLFQWCERNQLQTEIVVNDWGTFELLKDKRKWLVPSLGILLNKRRKDPRMQYKIGFSDEEGTLAENSLNNAFYRDFLQREYGITRFEQESCGYRIVLPEGKNHLHLPYYQTNTSQYCPLYARCHEGNRGRQRMPDACPQYCRDYVFSYPDHLHMVGRYNSLFGYDPRIMADATVLADYVEQGLERVVINLM